MQTFVESFQQMFFNFEMEIFKELLAEESMRLSSHMKDPLWLIKNMVQILITKFLLTRFYTSLCELF